MDNSLLCEHFCIYSICHWWKQKKKTWSLQSQWTLRPQVGTCPYCLFSYKDYRRYETAVEDTAYILLKSNQTDLLKIGYMNSSPHHQKKQKKSRAKEDFWAKVDPSLIHELHKVFNMDFKMFQYNWYLVFQMKTFLSWFQTTFSIWVPICTNNMTENLSV